MNEEIRNENGNVLISLKQSKTNKYLNVRTGIKAFVHKPKRKTLFNTFIRILIY